MSTRIVLEKLPSNSTGRIGNEIGQFKRQRVYILPTVHGLVYSMMLFVMLLGAINYNNSMAYMLCFLLTSLALVCMIHTYRNLCSVIISSNRPLPVFAGQQAIFPIQFDNSLGFEKFSIQIEQRNSNRRLFKKRNEVTRVFLGISAEEKTTAYYPMESSQRGVLKCSRLKLSTNFPLGLFVAWAYLQPEYSCLIYPSPRGHKQLPLNTLKEDDTEYGSQSGTDDFAGFRKYRPGDPVHSIAWKAFAKEQGLLVKQFSGKGSQTLIFNWESVSHINDIESRLSQLCYWVLIANQSSLNYGLELPQTKIEPSYGKSHKELCLETLARYGNDKE